MVRKSTVIGACALAATIFTAAGAQPEYVARVGAKKISVEEFQVRAQQLMKTGFHQINIEDENARVIFLDGIIAHELLVLDGLRRGLDRDSTIAGEVQRVEEQALRRRLYDVEALKGDYTFTEEELRLFFAERQYDTEVFSQHIVCATEAEALEVLDRLGKGESFEELFPLFSTPHIQKRFGPAGWVQWMKTGALLEPLIEPFNSMAPGEVYSRPVKTNSGYHVFKLKARRPVDFAETRDWVGRRLREVKRGRDMETYVNDLRSRYGLTLDEGVLRSLQALPPDVKQWPGEDQTLLSWRGGRLTAVNYLEHHRLARVRHPAALDSAALRKAADGLAGREIMLTEALWLKLDLDPEVRKKWEARRDELIIQWIYHLVGKGTAREQGVDEEEIRAFFDTNRDMFVREDGVLTDFDLVHDSIRTALATHIENQAMDDLIAGLREEYGEEIEIYPEVLAQAVLSRPTPPRNASGGTGR